MRSELGYQRKGNCEWHSLRWIRQPQLQNSNSFHAARWVVSLKSIRHTCWTRRLSATLLQGINLTISSHGNRRSLSLLWGQGFQFHSTFYLSWRHFLKERDIVSSVFFTLFLEKFSEFKRNSLRIFTLNQYLLGQKNELIKALLIKYLKAIKRVIRSRLAPSILLCT